MDVASLPSFVLQKKIIVFNHAFMISHSSAELNLLSRKKKEKKKKGKHIGLMGKQNYVMFFDFMLLASVPC